MKIKKITPETLIKKLKSEGREITFEEATEILKFLEMLVDAASEKHLR